MQPSHALPPYQTAEASLSLARQIMPITSTPIISMPTMRIVVMRLRPLVAAVAFLSGALQTAAGVAGGVVIADMLTGMFHNSQPEEIVNVVEENTIAQPDAAQPDITQPDNTQPDLQNTDWQDDASNQNGQDSGFFDSGFGNDDDSYSNSDDDSFF